MSSVVIIDSGGANIASLKFALARLSTEARVSRDANEIRRADRVILPGVGAARNAMQRLQELQLTGVICELTQPVLGICLGLQLLCEGSAEEDVECLGIFDGRAEKLPSSAQLPVPNMGWCPVQTKVQHPILSDQTDGDYYYFVHSYAVPQGTQTIASAQHAAPFSAALAVDNFVAVQFHPERSSTAGSNLLSNFLRWVP